MSEFVMPAPEVIHQLVKRSLDFHCHGVGRFDFTEIPELNLKEIEVILAERKQQCVLTLYLPKPNFEQFLDLMTLFDKGKKAGKFKHIVGFGLEGPLLASHGGTPAEGVWVPKKEHWQALAACGRKGLIYVILSPDAEFSESERLSKMNGLSNNIIWIAETLLEGGVLPAPGHFTKADPIVSAKALQSLFDVVAAWGHGPTITDHLFNDMPHVFKHAWRTPEERAKRDADLKEINLAGWSLDSLEKNLGPVPAVMIQNARKGIVKICQNCDGEHVDLAIVRRAVDLVGAENMLLMTDSIESKRLAGRALHMKKDSTLLYQDEDIVAAGTQSVSHQIRNMFSIGLTLKQIELITHHVPYQVIQQREIYIKEHNYVEANCM